MPHRPEKREGQVIGGMLRLFQKWLPRLRAGSAQDNSGEAAKEPERAQEHCLTNFAGGQHFFEYLLVVSLKKRRSGEDYEPTITYQFPKRENLLRGQQEEEERLLSAIPLFCFPDGNEWAPLTEYPRETFSFVLTNVDGSRKIGYCRRLLVCAAQNRPLLSAAFSAPQLGSLKPQLQKPRLPGSGGCRERTAQHQLPSRRPRPPPPQGVLHHQLRWLLRLVLQGRGGAGLPRSQVCLSPWWGFPLTASVRRATHG